MTVRIEPAAATGRGFDRFLELSYRMHQGRLAHWVPPLRSDVRAMFDPAKNPFFEHAAVQPFVAVHGGRVVGRVAAIENRAHNEYQEDRTGFFGFFECEDDAETARALFDAVDEWLRARRLDTARGPMNFSTNDDCGVLIDGFHRPPALLMPHNPPYYGPLLESAGFRKAKDLVAFYHNPTSIEPAIERLAQRAAKKSGIRTRAMDPRRFREEVELVRTLYNGAWSRNWGFVPMTAHEIDHLAAQLRPVFNPRIIRFAEIDGKLAGFALGLPDMNQVLAHLDGRIGPWGALKALWWSRRIDTARVLTLGVKEEFRNLGVDVVIYYDLLRAGILSGYRKAEYSWVLEDNLVMRGPLERLGARVDKVYRVYDRPVAA